MKNINTMNSSKHSIKIISAIYAKNIPNKKQYLKTCACKIINFEDIKSKALVKNRNNKVIQPTLVLKTLRLYKLLTVLVYKLKIKYQLLEGL